MSAQNLNAALFWRELDRRIKIPPDKNAITAMEFTRQAYETSLRWVVHIKIERVSGLPQSKLGKDFRALGVLRASLLELIIQILGIEPDAFDGRNAYQIFGDCIFQEMQATAKGAAAGTIPRATPLLSSEGAFVDRLKKVGAGDEKPEGWRLMEVVWWAIKLGENRPRWRQKYFCDDRKTTVLRKATEKPFLNAWESCHQVAKSSNLLASQKRGDEAQIITKAGGKGRKGNGTRKLDSKHIYLPLLKPLHSKGIIP